MSNQKQTTDWDKEFKRLTQKGDTILKRYENLLDAAVKSGFLEENEFVLAFETFKRHNVIQMSGSEDYKKRALTAFEKVTENLLKFQLKHIVFVPYLDQTGKDLFQRVFEIQIDLNGDLKPLLVAPGDEREREFQKALIHLSKKYGIYKERITAFSLFSSKEKVIDQKTFKKLRDGLVPIAEKYIKDNGHIFKIWSEEIRKLAVNNPPEPL